MQTYQHWEIVIVDDGSTDNSLDKVYDFKARLNADMRAKIRVICQSNQGGSSARALALKHSRGDFVALLDADDFWESSKLQKQISYLDLHPSIDLVLSNYILFFDTPQGKKKIKTRPIKLPDPPRVLVHDWLTTVGDGGLVESTGLFRRNYLEKLLDRNGSTMTAGLEMCLTAQWEGKLGLINQYLCGYTRSLGGWHHNKEDLVQSYSKFAEHSLFSEKLKDEVYDGLRCHLILWEIRKMRFSNFLPIFRKLVGSIDFYLFVYTMKTARRVGTRTIRLITLTKICKEYDNLKAQWLKISK